MNCGYGEKIILYFYGEAGAGLKASVENHLKTCASCRAGLAALSAAEAWLKAGNAQPSPAAVEAVMSLARAAAAENAGRFSFSMGQALFAGALTAVIAAMFAFSGRVETPELAWNSGLDSGLDSVEYSIYQAQSEMASTSNDWDYGYSAIEDESLRAQEKA